MNRFMDALWELKLRVDAHDENDEKANKAFETLKTFIANVEAEADAKATHKLSELDNAGVLKVLREHVEVQDHPDMFFYEKYPERMLIDMRYTVDKSIFTNKREREAIDKKNAEYNAVKKALGLPEYKER